MDARELAQVTGETPPADMLDAPVELVMPTEPELRSTGQQLADALLRYEVRAGLVGWTPGPYASTFGLALGEGERLSRITGLQDELELALGVKSVRVCPAPELSLVQVEVPNWPREERCLPRLSNVLVSAEGGPCCVAVGLGVTGEPVVVDLAELPHLLVAGTAGSGRGSLLSSIVMSMLMRATPEQVCLIMVDPKRVEFSCYEGLPHLYAPVVTEPKKAASALQWCAAEAERRLSVFARYRVRRIEEFNERVDSFWEPEEDIPPERMPRIVIVIDELADLMMVAGEDVESSIVRIAQLGRAAGIHLVVATQRPSADVVTGLIKANIDNRVALSVANGMSSSIILDENGAEKLLGYGDMLVKLRGSKPRRAQGCIVSEAEVDRVVGWWRERGGRPHNPLLVAAMEREADEGECAGGVPTGEDPLLWEAARIVVDSQDGSTSRLARALSVGYARAGRIMVCLVKPQFRECARISFGSVHETFAGLRTDPPTLTATS